MPNFKSLPVKAVGGRGGLTFSNLKTSVSISDGGFQLVTIAKTDGFCRDRFNLLEGLSLGVRTFYLEHLRRNSFHLQNVHGHDVPGRHEERYPSHRFSVYINCDTILQITCG